MDGTGSGEYTSGQTYFGGRSYLLQKTSASGRISVYQAVALSKGEDYTLSCHFKTQGGARAQFRAE